MEKQRGCQLWTIDCRAVYLRRGCIPPYVTHWYVYSWLFSSSHTRNLMQLHATQRHHTPTRVYFYKKKKKSRMKKKMWNEWERIEKRNRSQKREKGREREKEMRDQCANDQCCVPSARLLYSKTPAILMRLLLSSLLSVFFFFSLSLSCDYTPFLCTYSTPYIAKHPYHINAIPPCRYDDSIPPSLPSSCIPVFVHLVGNCTPKVKNFIFIFVCICF